MGSIVRGTKASAGGGTAFVGNTLILPDEANTDHDTIYSEFNGGIDDVNVRSTADVAETKINDISATAATHDDTATPGDSLAHVLPTSLSGEVQQLRYVEERLALGIGATRVDGAGTGTTFWGDFPARGANLIYNPNFSAFSSTLVTFGWTDLATGTPTFTKTALSGATLSEGAGFEMRIQAGSAAVAGLSQTLAGLKASTRYLVVARCRATTNAAHLTITGADVASSFRSFDTTTSSSTYTTIKGVFQTDSTPTSIIVKITTNGASGDDVKFSYVGVYECAADIVPLGESGTIEEFTSSAITLGSAGFTNLTNLLSVRVPGPGYEIYIDAEIPIANTNASVQTFAAQLTDTGGTAYSGAVYEQTMPASSTATAIIHHIITATLATAGTTFTFKVTGRSTAAANVTSNGTSLVTGTPTRTTYIRARLAKAN